MGLLSVQDEATSLFTGHRFLNSQICLWIGIIQALVCVWGIAQHVHSYHVYKKILRCDFEQGSLPLEAVDAIIFDVGLFYAMWGMKGCVAEYLDGGTGRLAWCVSHVLSLCFSLPWAFARRPKPYVLWPLLFQQSLYGICLLILFLAAFPRILTLLSEPQAAPLPALAVYILGTSLNFFLLYVLWRYYYHLDSLWSSAIRVRFGEPPPRDANNRSRRDRPMVPKEAVAMPEHRTSLPRPPVSLSLPLESDYEDPEDPGPIPIIVATRVSPDAIENLHLRAQAYRKRRCLPPTPEDHPKNFMPPGYRMRNSPL